MAMGWCYKDEPEVEPTEEETQSFICGDLQPCKGDEEMEGQRMKVT